MTNSENQTDNNSPLDQPDENVSPQESEATSTGASQPLRSGRGGIVFAVILGLLAVAGIAYLGYRVELQTVPGIATERARVTQLGTDLESIQLRDDERWNQQISEVQELRGRLAQQAEQIASLNAQFEQSNTEQLEKINTLVESMSSVYQNLDQRQDDWELNDVALLLLIGAKQLQVTGSPAAVLPVWQLASEQVARSADPQLLVVRAQLGKEIELLQSMEVVDIGRISNGLLGLIGSIDNLPLRTGLLQSAQRSSQAVEDQTEDLDSSGVRATFDEIWQDLKSLVRVKKVTDPSSLPLNPHIRNDLLERLKLSLSAAQIAALKGHGEVYQANLTYVMAALNEYFDGEHVAVIEYSEQLRDLARLSVVSSTPDVTVSYSLLQEILKRPPDA